MQSAWLDSVYVQSGRASIFYRHADRDRALEAFFDGLEVPVICLVSSPQGQDTAIFGSPGPRLVGPRLSCSESSGELRRWCQWYPRFGSERVHQLLMETRWRVGRLVLVLLRRFGRLGGGWRGNLNSSSCRPFRRRDFGRVLGRACLPYHLLKP